MRNTSFESLCIQLKWGGEGWGGFWKNKEKGFKEPEAVGNTKLDSPEDTKQQITYTEEQ